MDSVVKYIRDNAKKCFFGLIFFVVATVLTIKFFGFWCGLVSIFALYFLISLYIFSVVEPKEWEASIVFVLYLLAAVVFIGLFSGVSFANEDFFEKLDGWWEHAYFSVSMFTSLGFTEDKPLTFEAQFFAVAQSLLGSAHGVSFIFVMLGRSKWVEQKVQGIVKAPDNTRILELRMRNMSNALNFIIGLLVLNLLVMFFLLAR